MRASLFFVIAFFFGFSEQALCEGSPSKVKELVALQKFEEQVRETQRTCLQSIGSINMEMKFETDPSRFGGIGPGDTRWQQAKSIYADYLSAVCLEPTAHTQVAMLESAYRETLTPKQIEQAIAFYRGPLGQALVNSSRVANDRLASLQNADYSPAFMAAFERYQRELTTLKGP